MALHPAIAQTPVTWTFEGPSGSSDRIIALAVHPRNDSIIYAAAPGGGVWKTQDAGASWAPAFDSQLSLQVCALAIDPGFPDILYAGTGDGQSPRPRQGVMRSADGGKSWTGQTRFTNRPVCALGVDPTNSSRIFAGSEEGLFVSSDSGTSWTKLLKSPVTSIAFGSPGVVYAGILGDVSAGLREHLVARSPDSGRNWTDLPLPRNLAAPLAMTNWVTLMTSGGTLFAAVAYQSGSTSQLDFYSSVDAGSQWIAAFGIGPARPPMALVAQSGNLYMAGTSLLTSADGGSTWTVIPTVSTDFHAAIFTGGTLILAGEKGFEAPFGAAQPFSPLPVVQILGVSIDSAQRIWAGGPAGLFGLFPSSAFNRTGVPGIGSVGRVSTVTAAGVTNIYTAGANNIYESTDSGVTFSAQTVIPSTEPRALYPPLVVDPAIPSSAYTAGRSLYHTTDGGLAWTAVSIVDPDPTRVVIALAAAPASRSTLFAATACLPEVVLATCPPISVIWRSTNAGQTWVQMSVVAGLVNKFAVDPRQNFRVYAAIGAFPAGPSASAGLVPGDLLVSINNGAAWTSLLGNMPRTSINSVLVDATSLPPQFNLPAQTLYAGTDAGVFVSFDAGTRWMNLSSGLPASPITDVALLQPEGILVASTFGRGVYRASVLGLAPGLFVYPLSLELTLTRGASTNAGLVVNNLSTVSTVDWQLTAIDTPWLSLPQPNGTIRPLGLSQVAVGISAANLRMGTSVGRLQLTSPFGAQDVLVVANVTPAPGQMRIAAGNDASGLPGVSLPPLQVLVLDEDQLPLAGVPVTFTITAGGGSLNEREATTNASGIAGVVLTLPEKPAAVQVVANSGTFSVTFSATAIAAPSLLTDSIFNGVTFNANTSFGPGSILAILGENLASTDAVAANVLPTSLATTRVLVSTPGGEVPLSLFSVSPQQIWALMPFDILPGRYMLYAEVGALTSNKVEISIAAFDPGIFAINGSGRGPGIFIKDNGSLITASNPADRGSTVSFFAAGLGAVSPPIEAGQPGALTEPLNRTIQAPQVFFDRFAANVVYSGLAPGTPGRYLVTVRVPVSLSPATNVSVSMTIGGFTSNRVTIPVR